MTGTGKSVRRFVVNFFPKIQSYKKSETNTQLHEANTQRKVKRSNWEKKLST